MEELKTFRARHNMTLAELGRLVGVSRGTVFRWEDGSRSVSIKRLGKVAEVTGIPREKLRPDIFGDAQ